MSKEFLKISRRASGFNGIGILFYDWKQIMALLLRR